MLSERQEILLTFLIKEYIGSAEPVSSQLLKRASKLDISPATVRNDLQELTKEGYIEQPHTSAGRIPTKKAYQYFTQKMITQEDIFSDFMAKEMAKAQEKIDQELKLAGELMKSLEKASSTLKITRIREGADFTEIMEVISYSKTSNDENSIAKILKALENF